MSVTVRALRGDEVSAEKGRGECAANGVRAETPRTENWSVTTAKWSRLGAEMSDLRGRPHLLHHVCKVENMRYGNS